MSKKLHKLVDLAALLSLRATSPEAHELAARKRREAREALDCALMELGKLISTLNHLEEDSSIARKREN